LNPRVLVLIPAYNEEKSIAGVLSGLRQVAPEFDRLVINDGSKDRTGEVVAESGETQLRLSCNLGYEFRLRVGFTNRLEICAPTGL
jgi:glycosyltransferase involved in cell wall biosynthesis